MDNVSFQQIIKRIPLLKYGYRGSFPSDYVPTLDNDTFAIIITQPNNMQGKHWIKIENSRHKLYFADAPGQPRFLKQQYKQMMPGHYNLIPAFAISTRYMQLFLTSSSEKKKLPEFTKIMYFLYR